MEYKKKDKKHKKHKKKMCCLCNDSRGFKFCWCKNNYYCVFCAMDLDHCYSCSCYFPEFITKCRKYLKYEKIKRDNMIN